MRAVAIVAMAALLGSHVEAAIAASTSISLRLVRPGAAPCEVNAIRFELAEGSDREQAFDPAAIVGSVPVEKPTVVPASARTLSAVSPNCWSETTPYISGSAAASIRLWRRAMLSAHFEGIKGDLPPIRMAVVDVVADDGEEVQEIDCAHSGSVAQCALPALRPMHVRLESDGFAPIYVKNVSANEGRIVDVGPYALLPAYKLDGRVLRRDGQPIRDAHVRLLPATVGELTRAERLLRTRAATTDSKGYYRLHNIEPGLYRLVSEAPGLAEAVAESVRIVDRDVRAAPLVHSDRSRLEVLLTPPVAPDNTPWRVRVMREGTREDEFVVVGQGTASPSGAWSSDALQNGAVTVIVLDRSGSQVARQQVVLDGGAMHALIAISGISVGGKLLSGDDGVAGALKFTLPAAGLAVEAKASEDGTFAALFPKAGSWAVSVTSPPDSSARIVLDPVRIADGIDPLLVRLPGGRVEGVVKDQEGHPAEAIVSVRRDQRVVAQTKSAADGKFTLNNLNEVGQTIEAEGLAGVAAPAELDLAQDHHIEIDLTLRPSEKLQGVVVAPSGRPMSGAIVRAVDLGNGEYEDTIADAEGLFAIDMRSAGTVDVIVIAPPAPILARRFAPAQWHGHQLTLALPAQSAILRVSAIRLPPWPIVTSADGVARSLALFVMPQFGAGMMREVVDGALQFVVEPGPMKICRESDCRELLLQPGSTTHVKFLPAQETP